MLRILTVLSLVLSAGAANAADAPAAAPKKNPATSMLPDGSELKGVMLPRYDENHTLVGVLRSKTMRLVNAGQIDGRTVTVELFNPDQSPKGRIDLVSATIYQEKGFLTAKEPVVIRSDQMTTSGNGLCYFFKLGRGFLPGPATTVLKLTPRTP